MPYTIVNAPIYGGVPWTGVIDMDTMELVYDEPDDRFLDIMSIAIELAGAE